MRVKEAVIGITSMWQQQALCDSQVSASVWQRVWYHKACDNTKRAAAACCSN